MRARPARVNTVNRGREDPLQEEHWDGPSDQEVRVITPSPPAPPAPPGPYSPLMVSPSPCASRLLRTGTQQWNPEVPAWEPRDHDVRPWACGQLQGQLQSPVQLQSPAQLQLPGQLPAAAVWASTTWVDGPEFLGIGPIPMPGSSPAIPLYRPSYGPATMGWHPAFYTGAGGVCCY